LENAFGFRNRNQFLFSDETTILFLFSGNRNQETTVLGLFPLENLKREIRLSSHLLRNGLYLTRRLPLSNICIQLHMCIYMCIASHNIYIYIYTRLSLYHERIQYICIYTRAACLIIYVYTHIHIFLSPICVSNTYVYIHVRCVSKLDDGLISRERAVRMSNAANMQRCVHLTYKVYIYIYMYLHMYWICK